MADNRFFRTFRTLFRSPAQLPKAYIQGNTRKYWSPVQLFLFVNILYFLFPLVNSFNTSLYSHRHRQVYSKEVNPVVGNYLNENAITTEEFANVFDRKSSQISKLLLIILVLFHALPMSVVLVFAPRFYFTDVLTISAYFTAFYILGFLILLPLGASTVNWILGNGLQFLFGEMIFSLILLLGMLIVLTYLLKKALSITYGSAFIPALLTILLAVPTYFLYRFLLFWVTFWVVA
jgi:hypothetical protein